MLGYTSFKFPFTAINLAPNDLSLNRLANIVEVVILSNYLIKILSASTFVMIDETVINNSAIFRS